MIKTAAVTSAKLAAASKKAVQALPAKGHGISVPTVELAAKMQGKASVKATLTVEQRVNAIGRQIQEDYGVAVVPKRIKTPNPYDMTAGEAASIMQKAGILTKAGNLSPSYK